MTTEPHRRAPGITLKAAGSGRELRLDRAGAPLALLCVTQETSGAVEGIRTAIRERYADPQEVIVASVVNASAVPRLMRKMAESALGSRYRDAGSRLGEGKEPHDFIVILQDWKGEVVAALGALDPKQLAVVVVTAGGEIAGVYQGEEPAKAAIELLGQAGA